MSRPLIRGSLSVLKWALCGVGVVALLLTALIATPLQRPPELPSISDAARHRRSAAPCRRSSGSRPATAPGWLPALSGAGRRRPGASPSWCTARPARASRIHALAEALAARGVETYAPDIRGHGASGTRGDIGYLGQLEDDLADFVARDPQDQSRPRR